jgi:hypothetical protein
MRAFILPALALCLLASCAMPGSRPPSASSPPAVLLSEYNGNFTYTVDAGAVPKNVYFVFTNSSLDASASAASVRAVAGPIAVDGQEIAESSLQPAGGPPASGGGIKELLARSNRDISTFAPNSPALSSSAGPSPSAPSFDTVGQSSALNDIDAAGASISEGAHCRYVSSPITVADGTQRTLNIWVADDCWYGATGEGMVGSGPSQKAHGINQAMVDALAAKFLSNGTTDIYALDTAILGPEWGDTSASPYPYASKLIPFDKQITILLSDIGQDNSDNGGIVGYFWDVNNYLKTWYSASNARIMFVVDAVMYANPNANGSSSTGGSGWAATNYWAEEVFSTLAHEFQHMIQFYRKGILARADAQTADTWINEMCSQLVEDLVSYNLHVMGPRGVAWNDATAGSAGNVDGRIPWFNQTPLIDPSGNITGYQSMGYYSLLGEAGYPWPDYSFSYAFGSWILRNYGGASFVKNVVSDPATDSSCVTNAVAKATGRSVTMAELLSRWAVSVLGSDRTDMPPGYRYNTGAWTSSSEGGQTYRLGSIDFFDYSPPPQLLQNKGAVPGGAISRAANVYYLAASGLSGTRTWNLRVPQGVSFSVFVTP